MEILVQTNEYVASCEEGFNEEGEGYVFLHLEVHNWNKSVYKSLQEDFNKVINEFKGRGYDRVSFYLPVEASTKFHEKMRPLDYLVKFGPNMEYQAGGWFTGE